jgi:hypothetical protein
MDVGSLFIADPQAAELVEPCECPLHYPSPPPEPAAVVRVTLCQQRFDALCTQPPVTSESAGTLHKDLNRGCSCSSQIHRLPAIMKAANW